MSTASARTMPISGWACAPERNLMPSRINAAEASGNSGPGRRLGRAAEDVAHAADGVDELRRRGVVFKCRTEPVDVDIDRPRLARVVVAPDVLEELVAGERLPGVAEQERQQLERLRLDRQRLSVAQEPVPGEVDLDAPEIDDRRPVDRRRRLLGPAEQRPDPRRE